MFGGTAFGGGFGQPAQQQPAAPAFGAPAASPFGGSTFGQPAQPAANPFGAATTATPLFGAQSPAPAFGQAAPAAAPAFGATTGATGFGATGFGAAAKPAGFGGFGTTTAPNPFGAPSPAPAFGAPAQQSAPAFGGLGTAPSFGNTPAFGASTTPAFGAPAATPAFGGFGTAASTPAFGQAAAAPANPFGAAPTTGFGATAPAFGASTATTTTGFGAPAAAPAFGASTTGNLFGTPAAPSPFGATAQPAASGFGGFGAPAAGATPTTGTRNVPYTKTKDPDAPAGSAPPPFLMSISAMSNFTPPNNGPTTSIRSHEELRWEDYQAGVKNQSAGPPPAAPTGFGAPAAGGFSFGGGAQPAAQPATGFGAAATPNPFGAPASAPAFGTTPAFGATTPAAQPSLFGTSPAPAASPGLFGAASTPGFGGFGATQAAASAPSMFGATTATTGFGTTFGSTTPFGGASSAAGFNLSSTPSMFGQASAPATTSLFGAASSPATGAFGQPAAPALGAVGSPFGAASSASAFGTSTFGAFGATAAKPATPFGTTGGLFGQTQPAATGGLFGNTGTAFNFSSTPAASSPSLFGPTTASTGLSFGTGGLFGNTAPAAGGGLFGNAAPAAAPVQPPTVAQPAYGSFNALPAVPEAKVGITARAARPTSISTGSKASPLLSMRQGPVRYGASVRPKADQPTALGLVSGLTPTGMLPASTGTPAGGFSDLLTRVPPAGGAAGAVAASGGAGGLLPVRHNPHRLFITAPPPSTEAASSGAAFLSPVRPVSVRGRDGTPDGPHTGATADDGYDTAAATPNGAGAADLNGYANGRTGGSAAAAASGGRGGAFADAPAGSEPHLPRLGRLVSEGYTFSPSLDELRLLHSQNPANLASVSNFTVSRAGVGQVRWVVPVDVRGLALANIVSISFGEVVCYPDPTTKPPQGTGLNRPAELTLYGVYRKDKETGAPIKDGPKAQAYEKALRQMCGKMGAKFVSYKLDGGVWKFEVEHFSRYGLMDIDDDDGAGADAAAAAEGVGEAPGARRFGLADGGLEEEPAAAAPPAAAAAALAIAHPLMLGRGLAGGLRLGLVGGPAASAAGGQLLAVAEDSGMEPSVGPGQREADGAGSESGGAGAVAGDQAMSEARAQLRFGDDALDGEISGGVVGPAATVGGTAAAARAAAAAAGGGSIGGSLAAGSLALGGEDAVGDFAPPAAPLQHSLATSLAHDPVRIRALHDAFFGGVGAGGAAAAALAGGGLAAGFLGMGGQGQGQGQLAAAASVVSMAGLGGREAPRGAAVSSGLTTVGATNWRRATPALTPGAPASVVGRGAALSAGPDGASAAPSALLLGVGSPISLALARPVAARPAAATPDPDDASAAALPLRDVRTAGYLTDAGLAMGRSFRVGWGPGGVLVVPGAADAASATEICLTRVRVEGEAAAYGDMYGSPGAGGSGADEGVEELRERLRAALEVHLAASKPVPARAEAADGEAADGNDDAAEVPQWRLCVDGRELPVLVDRYVKVCERQLAALAAGDRGGGAAAGGADADGGDPEVARLRHEVDTWRLVEVLFARIDGETPEDGPDAESRGAAAAGAGDDPMVMSTPTATPTQPGTAAVGSPGGGDDGSAAAAAPSRLLLAALQRRSALSGWLQRQAKRRVESDLAAAGQGAGGGSAATVVLQLLAAHQLAAAAGAAAAIGDTRLAVLIAKAGTRTSARDLINQQLSLWKRSGFTEHMAAERLAAYHLLAGQVLEAQRLLALDWRRMLGLNLWYGTPSTASPMAAVRQYVVDCHVEPGTVPHPAPYHVEGLEPSATGAVAGAGVAAAGGATDVQWELMRLWATTPSAAAADCMETGTLATAAGVTAAAANARREWLGGGGCGRLLRVAGYSPNPLDHSLAWHIMTALQAADVLPYPGTAPASHDPELPPHDKELLAAAIEFVSQLHMAGGLCEWAVYAALHVPDLPQLGPAGAVRRRLVRELLAATAPEWMEDEARTTFLTSTLRLPRHLLAEAAATWLQYTRDAPARCAALLAAGRAAAAHAVFACHVAPGLFLAGAWGKLAELVSELEPAAAGLAGWPTGGGLYGAYLALFGRQLQQGGAAGAGVGSGGGVELAELLGFARQVQEAQMELEAGAVGGAGAGVGVLQAAAGGAGAGEGAEGLVGAEGEEGDDGLRLRQRLVLGRMAARVHGALMAAGAGAGGVGGQGAWEVRSQALHWGLVLGGCSAASELQLAGVAAAVAEAGAGIAC